MKTIKIFKKKIGQLDKKNKRLVLNTAMSLFTKAGAVLISLFMLPLYMSFFSNLEVLGLWFTALSVLSLVLTFDLGIGNGLRNHLVIAFEANDKVKVSKYISSAYIMVGIAVLLITISGFIIFYFVDWNIVFNVSTDLIPKDTLLEVIRIIFIGIMFQFFLRLIISIMYAMQNAALPNLLTLTSSIFLLLFISISKIEDPVTNIRKLAYINILTANLPILIATIILFSKKLNYGIPNFKLFDKKYAFNIIKLGGTFFWLQIMFMIIINTNEFLISWTTGASFVVDYKIYNSLFGITGTIFLLALTPVWSEVTQAFAQENIAWIRKLYFRLYKIGLLGVFFQIVLIFILQILIDFWLDENKINAQMNYSLVFALSGILFIWNAILSSFANGIGKLKTSIIYLTLGALLNIPLAFILTKMFNTWIGVVLANVISLLPFCIMQTIWFYKYFNKGNSNFESQGSIIS